MLWTQKKPLFCTNITCRTSHWRGKTIRKIKKRSNRTNSKTIGGSPKNQNGVW